MEKNLITVDRKKKALHHNVTGRECRGDMKRLAAGGS